jgi:hypothetical protein
MLSSDHHLIGGAFDLKEWNGWARYQKTWLARSSKQSIGLCSKRSKRDVNTVKRACGAVTIAAGFARG